MPKSTTPKQNVPAQNLNAQIAKFLRSKPSSTAVAIAVDLREDRKKVSSELRRMRDAGQVVSSGQTRATVYALSGKAAA